MSNNFDKDELEGFKTSEHRRAVHGLIFVIPVSSLDDNRHMVQIKREFVKITGAFVVLLTMVDDLCSDIRIDPLKQNFYVENCVTKLAAMLKIPESRVLIGVNYISETNKTAAIDRNNFNTIYTILSNLPVNTPPFAKKVQSQSKFQYDDGT